MAFTNPDDETLRALLKAARRIAVIGLSPKPDRPSFQVAAALQRYGYAVVPVRPATAEVLGEACHAELADVPGVVDMANVFRAPEHVEPIVDACIDRGVKVLWLQEGVINEAAAERACAAGLTVVMDRCLWKEYCRLGLEDE